MSTRAKSKSNDNDEGSPTNSEILRILRNLEKSVANVEKNVEDVKFGQGKLEVKLERLTERIDDHHKVIKDLQKSCNFFFEEPQSMKVLTDDAMKAVHENTRQSMEYLIKITLLESITDEMQRYSRKFNLRFVGIPEENDPRQENCLAKVQHLIEENLEMVADIENAHRVGKSMEGKPRHIIAKFLRRPERHLVLQRRNALKENAGIMVFEDLIHKDLQARKRLAPIVEARQLGKRTRFVKHGAHI